MYFYHLKLHRAGLSLEENDSGANVWFTVNIIIKWLLHFAESLSHTPHAAVSDQSFGTAVGIVLCQTSNLNRRRNKTTRQLYFIS